DRRHAFLDNILYACHLISGCNGIACGLRIRLLAVRVCCTACPKQQQGRKGNCGKKLVICFHLYCILLCQMSPSDIPNGVRPEKPHPVRKRLCGKRSEQKMFYGNQAMVAAAACACCTSRFWIA